MKPEWNRGFTWKVLNSLYLWDVKTVKPNYSIFWSDESETEMIVQFQPHIPDIPQVAASETGDTDIRL